jgi:DNA-binding response OmpR family regulator
VSVKRILVVDDDENLREVLSAILSQRDRMVDMATDGIEAVALIGQRRYDLVLTDLSMPGLDGPSLYDAIRSLHPTSAPRVIFMTGHADGGGYADFLKGTTEPILEKPFNLDVVRNLVNVLLRG